MGNRLAASTSAYLRSAAHQPINWHEFGEEAFAQARKLERPLLLDIGAIWCHWCHVIDRESYENAEIADFINRHFVPIKVDRDQRPDVDARYQQAVQALSGQGGWPLTAFLVWDGRLIYGGTYFPPATFKRLLLKIHALYQERRHELLSGTLNMRDMADQANSDALSQGIQALSVLSPNELQAACKAFNDTLLIAINNTGDSEHGGFGTQPKFPHFSTLEWLIAYAYRTPHADDAVAMLEKALNGMARGGIYDQAAGGFHRYSVDERWHVPHFEKMAYDNAEALKVYAQAARLTGKAFYREIAEGIADWVGQWLCDPEHGGFYASQDADIDLNDDGDHFTWSPEEFELALADETPGAVELARRYYDIHEQGDMPHAKGRNVLRIAVSAEEMAQALSWPPRDVEETLARVRGKLLEARRKRPAPFVDRTLYVNWNGMMIAAWFEAADLLDRSDWRDFAEKSLNRMLADFYREGETVFHTRGVPGFLDDYAWLALATLQGHQSTENALYFEIACDLAARMLERFEDAKAGGFYDAAFDENAIGLLKFRQKPAEDTPSSSPNAIALQVLQRLYAMTGDERYRQSLERGLQSLLVIHELSGLFVSALGLVALNYEQPPPRLEAMGCDAELKHAARQLFAPGKTLVYHPEAPSAEIRLCEGEHCLPPIREARLLPDRSLSFRQA